MAKRANRKKQGQQGALAPQCLITSLDALGTKCGSALRRALDFSQILAQKRLRGRTTSLYFFKAPKVEAEIRGENRPVLQLPIADHWLHVAIDLDVIADKLWRLTHVSLGVLQGDPSTLLKKPLLRAEWQLHTEPDHSGGHAQPHWHVLIASDAPEPSFAKVIEDARGFEAFLVGTPTVVPAGKALGHFHYAMVSDWHRTPSNGPCWLLESEAALLSWLEGCTRYICHQLGHVDRKSATADALPAS